MHYFRTLPFVALIGLLLCSSICTGQDYKKIWEHISKNERKEAVDIIEVKLKTKKASIDEYLTYIFLKCFDGKEDRITDYLDHVRESENPDAYIYALWFTTPVLGGYGYKAPHQLALLNELITNKARHGTLRASAHYGMGHHYTSTHQFSMLKEEHQKIGGLSNWQLAGPFNNISGSGFNKDYAPIKDPSGSAVFASTENAPIKWFAPAEMPNEGWVFPEYFISESAGSVIFAQTFVNSPMDQDIYLCTGFAGNIKVWVNDQLVIRVPEEKTTEMDTYNTKCHLNAGYNRLLVQVGSDDRESNFIVRLTDAKFDPIPTITTVASPQKYQKTEGESLTNGIPLFAEAYFLQNIKKDPENILNYMLLGRTYMRNKKVFEARKIIEQALLLAPGNSLLKYELSLCYLNENNRTGLSEVYEYFKENERQSLISYVLRTSELQEQEKYQEALDTLETRMKIYGIDESSYEQKIRLLSKLNTVPQLVSFIYEAQKKYPRNALFLNFVFNVEKDLNKNPKKALKILNDYLSHNFNYGLSNLLIKEYFSQNNSKKAYEVLQERIETWPFNTETRLQLLNRYLEQQKYSEAYDLCNFMLKMKPHSGGYYDNKASVEEALGKNQEAIESYQSALTYLPTLYESRDKQRKLQNKKNLFEAVPHDRIEDLISRTGKNIRLEDYDYYFLQFVQADVIYPEGGREEEHAYAIKILNQRGIDRYKETSLGYNENTETLIIEDAQLIKSDGKRIRPEVSGSQVVWTGLEANDIIYMKYKKKIYQKGKFAQEFYDKYIFDGFIPVEVARYSLVIPPSRKFYHKVINGDLEPKVSDFEDYKVYVWEKTITSAIKDEAYMPAAADFATTLHISTMNDWNEIAQWYSDVVYSKIATDNDYEVAEVYNKLFDGKTNLSAEKKAKIIYDYITKNINYSSVSFRQSGLIPQKASITINTHLGDCKDISTLFISLANMAQLKSNLVLASTRDNGKKDMLLPSFLFNHCIVKYMDEKNSEHFLELTDRYLPFKSLPKDLYQAMSLTIPSKDERDSKHVLIPINAANKTVDKVITKQKIGLSGNEMNITYTSTKHGNLSNWTRQTYQSLNQENTLKKMQESVSKKFTNPIKINDVSFVSLNELADSISTTVNLNVKNEVKQIGDQSVFVIPYLDLIIASSVLNLDTRNYDFEYWNYEDADEYKTEIEINLPGDKTFMEIPKNEKMTFNNISYSLSYTKTAPNKLIVLREARIDRSNITPADYVKFKTFASKIVEKEGSYISFK